jgi:hypothetical protein
MLEGISLGSYLLLVDYTGRIFRQGKARLSSDVAGVLDRLGTCAEFWSHRLQAMLKKSRLLGNYFATNPDRLRAAAEQRGVHHVDNAVSLAAGASG